MKTLLLSLALLISTVHVSQAGGERTAGPTHKVVLSAAKYLMKLYNKNSSMKQVNVPELRGYSLTQVALIDANSSKGALAEFDYVAVYQQKGSANLKVVLYNNQNQEQLTLDSIRAVSFGSDSANTRITLQRAGKNGNICGETLMVPGTVQVAQKG